MAFLGNVRSQHGPITVKTLKVQKSHFWMKFTLHFLMIQLRDDGLLKLELSMNPNANFPRKFWRSLLMKVDILIEHQSTSVINHLQWAMILGFQSLGRPVSLDTDIQHPMGW